jgi:hypothetical protein
METIKSCVQNQINTFIIEYLEDRYKNHVSDEFLKTYLIRSFEDCYREAIQGSSVINFQNVAYASSVYLFETLLEYGCKISGNGHHIAQAFADGFKNYDYQGNFNSEVCDTCQRR